jgi:DNA repair protein RadC
MKPRKQAIVTAKTTTDGYVLKRADEERVFEPLARLVGRVTAARLIHELGLDGLSRMAVDEIATCGKVRRDVATRIVAARDVVGALASRAETFASDADEALKHVSPEFRSAEIERVMAVLLDGRHRVLGTLVVAQGGGWSASVSMADVLRPIVRRGCRSFILVHNHPSQDPTPTREDAAFTSHLARAAKVIGVVLCDHLVVTARSHVSMLYAGLMPTIGEVAA